MCNRAVKTRAREQKSSDQNREPSSDFNFLTAANTTSSEITRESKSLEDTSMEFGALSGCNCPELPETNPFSYAFLWVQPVSWN